MELKDYRKLSKEELLARIEIAKKNKNVVVLAHSYQKLEVQQVADYIGDSLGLAREAAKTDADLIVFCGVHFMAESAKILSYNKKVITPNVRAGCPMAMMADAEKVRKIKKEYPKAMIVTYVNSTAEVKAESDICVTSSNAVKIIKAFPDREIIFVPDRNLGSYCASQNNRELILWDGYCHVHDEISVGDIYLARRKYPNCLLLVHPETRPEIQELADFIGSTTQIMDFVDQNINNNKYDGFLIGTEVEIAYFLCQKYPDKNIYPLADHAECYNMKKIELYHVCYALENEKEEIFVPEEIAKKAYQALEKMFEFS